jgi:hypothetical protein
MVGVVLARSSSVSARKQYSDEVLIAAVQGTTMHFA